MLSRTAISAVDKIARNVMSQENVSVYRKKKRDKRKTDIKGEKTSRLLQSYSCNQIFSRLQKEKNFAVDVQARPHSVCVGCARVYRNSMYRGCSCIMYYVSVFFLFLLSLSFVSFTFSFSNRLTIPLGPMYSRIFHTQLFLFRSSQNRISKNTAE